MSIGFVCNAKSLQKSLEKKKILLQTVSWRTGKRFLTMFQGLLLKIHVISTELTSLDTLQNDC